MVKVKGVKLYPSQIPLVLKAFPELTGKYRILISSTGATETLKMLVEGNVTQGYDISSLQKRLKEALLILPNQIEVVKNLEDGPNIMDQRHVV
jgi:phenylacetate-CoA ligase